MRKLLPILALLVPLTVALGEGASPPAKPAGAKGAAATPAGPASLGTDAPALALPPKTGSHIPPDDNLCIQCHQEQDPKDPVTKRLYIDRKGLADDVHWKKGVNCSDCHGGDPKTAEANQAHARENGFRKPAATAWKMCAACRESQGLDLLKSVHDKAGPKDEQGRGTPLECRACHGPEQHHILPVTDSRSPVFVDHQVQTCGLATGRSGTASAAPRTATACTSRGYWSPPPAPVATAPTASIAQPTGGPLSIRAMWPQPAASVTVSSPNG